MPRQLQPPRQRISWRWVIVFALIAVSFGLGFVGLREHFGTEKSFWDLVYLTLQLFFLESGDVGGQIEPPLQIARFLAPVTTAYTLVMATLALFTIQLQRAWLWLRAGHVVICGLGKKGVRLVEELRKEGRRVVVIEQDRDADGLAHCRAIGAVVLQGAANDEWLLSKSYVHRADSLISVTGDDGVNVETAVLAHALNAKRSPLRKPLQCVVHVGEPRLQQLFREHRIYGDENDPFDLDFFNVFEVAARVMLREPPLLLSPGAAPHLLIVGLGQFGTALLRRTLKDWQIEHPDSEQRLTITVIDNQAALREQQFRLRYPTLIETADVRFVPMDYHSPAFARGAFLSGDGDVPPISAAHICIDSDPIALSVALTLLPGLRKRGVPIVMRVSEEAGLAALLRGSGHMQPAIAGIRPVGLLDLTCVPEVVLGGTREILAQAIHHGYLYDRLSEGAEYASNKALVSWERLDEHLKQSNRRQADHISDKLAAINCKMVPNTNDEIRLFHFTEQEIEKLARMEHDRWVDERLAAGWKLGPSKDHDRRITPYLVTWEELSDEVRDYDAEFVRRLPAHLAKADYEIRRIDESTA